MKGVRNTGTYLDRPTIYTVSIITLLLVGAGIVGKIHRGWHNKGGSQLIRLIEELPNKLRETTGSESLGKSRRNYDQSPVDEEIDGEIWPAYRVGGGLIKVNNRDYGKFSKENCILSGGYCIVTNSPTIDLSVNITHDKDISRISVKGGYDPVPDPDRPGYVIRKEQFTDFTERAETRTTWNYELTENWASVFKDKNSSIILRGVPLMGGNNVLRVFIRDQTGSWTDRPSFIVDYIPNRKFGEKHFESELQGIIESSAEKGHPYTPEGIVKEREEYIKVLDELFGPN